MATFVGRPPLMNYRYCNLVPPLDLSDDILVAGGEALDKAISELDSSGWNTHGVRYRMTSPRVRFQLAIYREQTLEIALGPVKPHDLVRKSKYVIRPTNMFCPADTTAQRNPRTRPNSLGVHTRPSPIRPTPRRR